MKNLLLLSLLLLSAPAFAVEVVVPSAASLCTTADRDRGKVVLGQIKAARGSTTNTVQVKLTTSENRVLWCYTDAVNPAVRVDQALNIKLVVVPDPDADADGVPDRIDQCANTPPDCDGCSSRVPVDSKGCPKP